MFYKNKRVEYSSVAKKLNVLASQQTIQNTTPKQFESQFIKQPKRQSDTQSNSLSTKRSNLGM